jgi:cell division septum initiation protein DivIVA
MTQDERNEQLQRENTTLRQKVVELETRVSSLNDSLSMANFLLQASDKQAEEYRIAIDDLVSELSSRDSEITHLKTA